MAALSPHEQQYSRSVMVWSQTSVCEFSDRMMRTDLFLLGILSFLRRRIGRLLRYRFLCFTVTRFLGIRFGHELTLFGLPVKLAVLVIYLRTCIDPHKPFRLCVCDFSVSRRGCCY